MFSSLFFIYIKANYYIKVLAKPRLQEEDAVFKVKTPRRNTERKNTYNSDCSPPMSSSLSRMQPVKKNLPLRSLGVDLSAFLNKKDSSQERSSSSEMLNHQGKMQTSSKANSNNKRDTGCSFCVNNGESVEIYMSHPLKDALGKVVCPILRVHVCKLCGKLENILNNFNQMSMLNISLNLYR